MTIKNRIIISVVGLILALGIGLGTLYVFTGGSAAKASKIAEPLGQVFGLVVVFGLACLWLPYAARIGKERRAEMDRNKKKKRKRRQ